MDQLIKIQARAITPPAIGSLEAVATFNDVLQPWAAVNTLSLSGSYSRRFDGISIEDRPTHEIYINYDATIWPLDSDVHFVLLEDGRRLRIVGAKDLGENKITISILCTERGVGSKKATGA